MKQGQVQRGFKSFRQKVEKSRNAVDSIKSCKSCKYFSEDDECTNNSVTSFDMVKDPVKKVEFCTFWTPSWYKEK